MAANKATAGERDQNNNNAARPDWASKQMHVDPYQLPQKVAYDRASINPRAAAVDVTLDSKGAVMKRELECGLPLSLALPARAFEGVAARAFENEDGTTTVTLELRHADSELSVPLCVSEAVEDAACDWHSWARALKLPMLMIDEAGNANLVKDAGLTVSQAPSPRRRRVTSMKNRPNFLRRRKTGSVGEFRKLEANEIIARN